MEDVAKTLAAHGAWARRLARALTSDAERADDAVQEAWVAAVERGGTPSRGWLAQVVRNAVRRLGRADGRRSRREAAAARPEALPSAAELAADAEMQRDLVAAVLALEEPYLSTLVLRFYRDLSPAEIARLSGVPAGTVRSRLHRALGELRARLDARYGERDAWSAVLAPLLAPGAPAPGAPTAGGGASAKGNTTAAAAAVPAIGIAMGIKLQLALAGTVLVAGAAFFALRDRGTSPSPHADLARAEDAAAVLVAAPPLQADEPELVADAPPAGATREAVTSPAASAARPIRVRVVDPDGAGVEGATVTLSRFAWGRPVFATGSTDAKGRVALVPEGGPLERYRVRCKAGGFPSTERDCIDLDDEIELRLSWTASIAGVVREATSKRPVAGALVAGSGSSTTSGADGTYRLDELPIGSSTRIRARAPGLVLRDVAAVLPARGVHPLDLELERASPLRVRIVDRETGEPIAGATLAERDGDPAIAASDADGVLAVDVLVGAELVLVASAPDHVSVSWSWNVVDPPEEGAEATLPLVRTAWVEGIVLGANGAPLAGACVLCLFEQRTSGIAFTAERCAELGLPGALRDRLWDREHVTDASGAFRLPVLPDGDPFRLAASHEGLPQCFVGPLASPPPGGTITADVRMSAGGGVRGRVTRNGEPWAGARVSSQGNSGARTRRDGRYALDGEAAGSIRLVLRASLGGPVLQTADVVVEPGAYVERDFDFVQETARIHGRVVAPDGTPLERVAVAADAVDRDTGGPRVTAESARDGGFALEVLPHGVYVVSAYDGASGEVRVDHVPAGAEDLELVLARSGTLNLQLVDAATGEAPAMLASGRWGGTWRGSWRPSGERTFFEFTAGVDVYGRLAVELPPGTVDVILRFAADGYAPANVLGVAVPENGETEPIVVRLERGIEARLRIDADAEERHGLAGHFVFLLEDGELGSVEGPLPDAAPGPNRRIDGVRMRLEDPLLIDRRLDVAEPGVQVFRGLAPGRFHVRAFPDDILFEPASFDLPAASDAPIALRWRAR